MNSIRWVGGTALGLGLALAIGLGIHRAGHQRREQEQAMVLGVLSGDTAAFDSLRSTGERAVVLIEDFLCHYRRLNPSQIEQELACLARPDEPARRQAAARLTLLPEPANDLLKRYQDQTTGPEQKERLRQFIAGRAKAQKQVAGFLAGLYAEHFNRLFVARRARLEKDCRDPAVELFFAYAPFDQAWAMLRNGRPDLQLRFLLLRLYTGRDECALSNLELFSAPDILRVAAQTWWPVEIEPLAQDGAYRWSTRADATEGNTACHLLRLSVRPASQPGAKDEWVHLNRWSRWTYLFRYQPRVAGADALVFAENELRRQNRSSRSNPEAHRELADGGLWIPQPFDTNLIGRGACEAVSGVPATAFLPVVRLSREEEQHLHGRVLCEWARPLVPDTIQDRVHFSPNEFPPPQIFTDPSLAKDSPKNRSKRRR
jgi:hypothetical protein